jgi:FAD:protein FMN transferase
MTLAVNIFKTFFLVCSLLLAGCLRNEQQVEIKELKGEIFGSYYLVKYNGDLDKNKFAQELADFFKDFNNQFSTYQSSSVISQFNRLPKNSKLKVSPLFIEMLLLSQKFHQETEGAFDPTLGPIIKLWGFGGGKSNKAPSEAELKAALTKLGFSNIKWDDKSLQVWKEIDGLELDVNAFAPGWAADLIGKLLRKHKIENFMVDISGEILFSGMKDNKNYWIGGIETPSKEYAQGVHLALKMKNQALATSGSYRQYFDQNGVRKSHIIDPRTGRPVTHSVSSASVVAESAASADVWGTAMMVLGPEGLAISEKNDIKVLLLQAKKPDVFEELISKSMQQFIEAHKL